MQISILLGSNIVNLALTVVLGMAIGAIINKYRILMSMIAFVLVLGVFIGYLFNIGEVYSYTDNYKRSFFFFTDDITTIIALFFCWALLAKKFLYAAGLLVSALLSGGKISLILLLLMIVVHVYLSAERRYVIKSLGYTTLCAVLLYFSFIFAANTIEGKGLDKEVKIMLTPYIPELLENKVKGAGSCQNGQELDCFMQKSMTSIEHRYFSSIAGLWMTLQGGFPGENFPSSAEKFATLMVENNPFGMNDKYNISYDDWKKMGGVQNPYLAFGAGYGPYLLSFLILLFSILFFVCIDYLKKSEANFASVFIVFFMINVLFNQTQSWLQSYSVVLMALGVSCFFIFRYITAFIQKNDESRKVSLLTGGY